MNGYGFADRFSSSLSTAFNLPAEGLSPFDLVETAKATGVAPETIKQTYSTCLGEFEASPLLPSVVELRISAVLSLCQDSHFELALKEFNERKLIQSTAFVQTNLAAPVRPRVVPIFKLTGCVQHGRLCWDRSDYVVRRSMWRRVIPNFADAVRGETTLILGCGEFEEQVVDLLGELIAATTPSIGQIAIPSRDAILKFVNAKPLLEQQLSACETELSERQLVSKFNNMSPARGNRTAAIDNSIDGLAKFQVGRCVNLHLRSSIESSERVRLDDILFSPDLPLFDPFSHDLDFERTAKAEIVRKIEGAKLGAAEAVATVLLKGAAATGKTTLLKRIAFDLAKADNVVLWLAPSPLKTDEPELVELLSRAHELARTQAKRLICFLDDPFRPEQTQLSTLSNAAAKSAAEFTLVVSCRDSDFELRDGSTDLIFGDVRTTFDLADTLTDEEWNALPSYLVKLGIASTVSDAESQIANSTRRSTRDSLSLIYWLLPATKSTITSSVQEEYFRIGEAEAFQQVLLGEESRSPEILQAAYRFCAVADSFGVSVPIEVLVRAIDVDYADWLAATRDSNKAWGFLYPDEGLATAAYRTRCKVVTDILVDLVNGGLLSRSGEVNVLKKLLSACTGGSAIYHEFAVSLLAKNARLDSLAPDDGLLLYDAAMEALPAESSTLLHHKSLWLKNKCEQFQDAADLVEKALATPPYAYAVQQERPAHLHNTAAAIILDSVDAGEKSLDEGKDEIVRHLDAANKLDEESPYGIHVESRLVQRIAQHDMVDGVLLDDTVQLVSDSIDKLQRAIDHRESPIAERSHTSTELDMLESAKDSLVTTISSGGKVDPDAMWENHRNQHGFVLRGRELLEAARKRNKGTDFAAANQWVLDSIAKVQEEGLSVVAELWSLKIDVYYYWRICREISSGSGNPIAWDEFIGAISEEQRTRPGLPAMHSYMKALALAHKYEWAASNALFADLRRTRSIQKSLHVPRNMLLSENGGKRLVQGVIRQSGADKTFYSREVESDFRASRRGSWANDGDDDFAYIQFSFAGPMAIDRHHR